MADIEFIRCSGTNEDFIENCQLDEVSVKMDVSFEDLTKLQNS